MIKEQEVSNNLMSINVIGLLTYNAITYKLKYLDDVSIMKWENAQNI